LGILPIKKVAFAYNISIPDVAPLPGRFPDVDRATSTCLPKLTAHAADWFKRLKNRLPRLPLGLDRSTENAHKSDAA
jgi:hypothetical protein